MTALFWQLFAAAVLTFGLVAYLTVRVLDGCLALYRRWACRREMARAAVKIKMRVIESYDIGYDGVKRNRVSHAPEDSASRRVELEGLATAQDKRERRIH